MMKTELDNAFAARIRDTEHAPGHVVLLDYAEAVLKFGRLKGYTLLAAALAYISFTIAAPGLPRWADFVAIAVIVIARGVILEIRERRIMREFTEQRDEYMKARVA